MSPSVEILGLAPDHAEAMVAFIEGLPAGDLTFFKEAVDAEAVRSWTLEDRPGQRWVAVSDARVVGYVAVVPLAGWSDHVGEIRLVVGPGSRGTGLGRELARTALSGAVQAGLAKVVVELVADQESALRLFTDIGFGGEALLTKHVRDRDGNLRDLIMLAHYVDETWSLMDTLGLADELAE